jgi:hypothetical protein
VLIALGGGDRVRVADATWSQMWVKQSNQIAQNLAGAKAADDWAKKMNVVASVMQFDATCTYRQAMYKLGKWESPNDPDSDTSQPFARQGPKPIKPGNEARAPSP